LSRAVLVRLSRADAFASLGLDRRGALWNALAQEATHREFPLFCQTDDDDCAELPRLSCAEEVFADYQTTGLSLRAHPVSFYRKQLQALDIVPNDQLATWPANRRVRVAGIVLLRQRPSTAKGITFVTLEDETGTANLVVRKDVWERFYEVARKAAAMIAHGRLERKHGVIHVVVHRLEDLSCRLADLNARSRDFR
jgi:error-prone DNA polymerase